MSTSGRDSYQTPPALFERLDDMFGFNIDLAATGENFVHPRYFTGPCAETEWCKCGLCAPLANHRIFCNPPYSNLKPWIRRFQELSLRNSVVVAVLPADPTTEWWRMLTQTDGVCPDYILFTRKRVQFIHAQDCNCTSCKKGDRGANTKGTAIAIWARFGPTIVPRPRAMDAITTVWGWDYDGS